MDKGVLNHMITEGQLPAHAANPLHRDTRAAPSAKQLVSNMPCEVAAVFKAAFNAD